MKIMIHGAHLEVTPSIKIHIEDKIGAIEHMLDEKHAGLAEIRVEVGRSTEHHHKGNVFYAEANLKMGSEFFRATANHEDLHAAINDVRDELERQLKKHKTKEITKHRKPTDT